eukprot:5638874-Amphidinium_carterae.1
MLRMSSASVCRPPGRSNGPGSLSFLSWTSCASQAATRCRTEEKVKALSCAEFAAVAAPSLSKAERAGVSNLDSKPLWS